jgi:hypothetical protein
LSPRKLATLALAAAMLAALVPATVLAKGGSASVVYSSLVASPLHGNVPSLGAEAYAFNELGNAVTFAGKNRTLSQVVVTMSSWGCVSGHWYSGDCSTPAGATFSVPITFSVYTADGTRTLASSTQTFAIPYRPSASPKCGDGRWYDNALKTCFNGLATNITFSFSGVSLPDGVVYGIAYDTTHYGYHPIGESAACYGSAGGCGYDSLNIALSGDISAGSDTEPGFYWWNGAETENPNAPLVPAVQFKAAG